MNIEGLKKAVPVCFESKVTLLIHGQHGIGKSQGVRQAVEDSGIGKVEDFRLGQMADVGDIIGLLDLAKSDNFCEFKIPKRIHDVIEYCINNPDKYGVLFFDEMNRTTKDILQGVFEIVLDNSVNGVIFPDNMRCICAINPATDDYSVLDFDDKAFADRFCHVKFEPSSKDWLKYARSKDLSNAITGFIAEDSSFLEEELQDFELPSKPSRRSWFTVSRLMENCQDKPTLDELIIGMVGVETAYAFFDYQKKHGESVKGIEILENYKQHKKLVESLSSDDGNNRDDLINKICREIKEELAKKEQLSTTWEENLVAFLCAIPKDLGYGYTQEYIEIPSFLNTEGDTEQGLCGEKTKSSKKLIKHFSNWKNEEVVTEEKTNE